VERLEPEGPFAAGSSGWPTFRGRPPLPYRLVDVHAGARFADETTGPDAVVVRIRYAVQPRPHGGCRMTQTVEVSGPAEAEIGAGIAADVPVETAALAGLAAAGPPPTR
jgi:hypothetical protein